MCHPVLFCPHCFIPIAASRIAPPSIAISSGARNLLLLGVSHQRIPRAIKTALGMTRLNGKVDGGWQQWGQSAWLPFAVVRI
jgi:hypothetical protein